MSTQVKKKVDAAANVAAVGISSKRDNAPGNNAGHAHDGVVDLHVPITRVWTVVSNLFQALTEARGDLLSLMWSDSFRGIRNSTLSSSKPVGSTSPSKPKENNRSGPPLPRSFSTPVESLRCIYANKTVAAAAAGERTTAAHKANAAAEYCAPVAFGMNLDFERVQRGRSKSPAPNSTLNHEHQQQQPPLSCGTVDEPQVGSQSTSTTANITSTAASLAAATTVRTKAGTASKSAPPLYVSGGGGPCHDGKRICRASRYADLLRVEARQLREWRLAEQTFITSGKPSWL